MSFDDDHVPSPCTRVCTLDDDDVCLGCKRTVEEIKTWRSLDPVAQRALLKVLEERQARDGRRWSLPRWGRGRG